MHAGSAIHLRSFRSCTLLGSACRPRIRRPFAWNRRIVDWIQVPVVANMMNKGKKKGGGCEKQNLSAILLGSALIVNGAANDPTTIVKKIRGRNLHHCWLMGQPTARPRCFPCWNRCPFCSTICPKTSQPGDEKNMPHLRFVFFGVASDIYCSGLDLVARSFLQMILVPVSRKMMTHFSENKAAAS